MAIIGGSLNVLPGAFLHAGYISACPRSMQLSLHSFGSHTKDAPLVVIDVKEALALKDETPGGNTYQAHPPTPPSPAALTPGSLAGQGFILAGVVFFFLFLASLYRVRAGRKTLRGWPPWALALVTLLLLALPFLLGNRLGTAASVADGQIEWPGATHNAPAPWEGVPVKEYANPAAATNAILHALIINALPGCSDKITELAHIQGEVGFPMKPSEMTAGMVYALKTYGRDGWGRPFKMERFGTGAYRISSDGADGVPGNGDDVAFRLKRDLGRNWEADVNGLYLRPAKDGYQIFVHRVRDWLFRFDKLDEARSLTGTELFDYSDRHESLKEILAPVNLRQQKKVAAPEAALYFLARAKVSAHD